jgi:hypothetical protein
VTVDAGDTDVDTLVPCPSCDARGNASERQQALLVGTQCVLCDGFGSVGRLTARRWFESKTDPPPEAA